MALPDPPSRLSKLNANLPIHKLHDPICNYILSANMQISRLDESCFAIAKLLSANEQITYISAFVFSQSRRCSFASVEKMAFDREASYSHFAATTALHYAAGGKKKRLFSFLSDGCQTGVPWMRILLHSLPGNVIFLAQSRDREFRL